MRNLQNTSQNEYANQYLIAVCIIAMCTLMLYIGYSDASFLNRLLLWPIMAGGVIASVLFFFKYIKFHTMDEREWKEYARTYRAMLSKATYIHPLTNDIKTVRRGFSFPVLLFGGFVPLYRKQWKLAFSFFAIIWFAMIICSIVPVLGPAISRLFSGFSLAKRYNSLYENWLVKQGYYLSGTEYFNESASKGQALVKENISNISHFIGTSTDTVENQYKLTKTNTNENKLPVGDLANKRIKIIGIGGGGGNMVHQIYFESIYDVTYALCDTDDQTFADSPIPIKLQLGKSITQELKAEGCPSHASEAAEESEDDIKALLNDGTEVVIITAGMGGGTGTGATPVITRIAKEMNILTIGIVTMPFIFEGEKKIIQAIDGVECITQCVDALLIINNERLGKIYSDLNFVDAFAKVDDIVRITVDFIIKQGTSSLDFTSVENALKDADLDKIIQRGSGQRTLFMINPKKS